MIVEKLQKLGVNAIGLSGIDGQLLEGRRKNIVISENNKKRVIRNDYTGKVEKVNVNLLKLLLKNGYLPVISPPALSYAKEAINVDGDRAAAAVAGAVNAEVLLILSNTPGLLRDIKDEGSILREITKDDSEEAMSFAQGRMKKKVMGAFEALENGVSQVIFGDARIEEPITRALQGAGTVIH
jgi:acetylglutamate/LysW-gamma-L-alpha-aminoadipate kinase